MNNTVPLHLTDEELVYLYDALENNHALVKDVNDHWHSIFTTIQGKIIAKFRVNKDIVDEIRSNRFCKENQFNDTPLFMGAGWHSVNRCNMMHKRLSYATMILSGKQQNGGMGHEFDEQSDKQNEQKIKTALRDIIAAFDYKPEDLINGTLQSKEIEAGTE